MGVLIILGFILLVGTPGVYGFMRLVNFVSFSSIEYNNMAPETKRLERIKTRRRDFLRALYINLGFAVLFLLLYRFSGRLSA